MDYFSIILSAGKGTRMMSKHPKVIHSIIDVPMINLVISELEKAGIEKNNLIVGYKKEEVIEIVEKQFTNINFAVQEEQLGTGHAVMQAETLLKEQEGITIITCGDTPLISSEIFKSLISYHEAHKNDLTVLSAEVQNPFGYGRIIRNSENLLERIIEEKDANDIEKKVQEINTGVYCVDNRLLFEMLKKLDNNNEQKEYYLTDLIKIFKENKFQVDAYQINDEESIMGINDNIALAKAQNIAKLRINNKHLLNGVQIIDPQNTYIGFNVKIGKGTVIYPNNYITGNTIIGEDNILKASNFIENVKIGDNNQIGPMAYLRNNTEIANATRVGNFVELKNTKFSNESKVAHLTYLGDTEVGEKTNIGCGVITANYDGVNKNKTIIGSNNFIGSNVNLIAPVKLKDDVFVAAGTTVTHDVENHKFVIGRTKEEIKNRK